MSNLSRQGNRLYQPIFSPFLFVIASKETCSFNGSFAVTAKVTHIAPSSPVITITRSAVMIVKFAVTASHYFHTVRHHLFSYLQIFLIFSHFPLLPFQHQLCEVARRKVCFFMYCACVYFFCSLSKCRHVRKPTSCAYKHFPIFLSLSLSMHPPLVVRVVASSG